uniref:Uncharacterized protein n=1 Tax=Arundo donax TaxID=35708 RepID=A0A0A9EYY0_ARUDO
MNLSTKFGMSTDDCMYYKHTSLLEFLETAHHALFKIFYSSVELSCLCT